MAATHYYAVTDMTAIINPGGVNYTFDRANGTDQGSYVDPNGRFTVGCILVTNPQLPGFRVYFRSDADGSRDEVVFEYGDVWATTAPANLPAYTATITKNGATVATVSVPQHFWLSRWRWQSAPRPVTQTVAQLVAASLIPHYDASQLGVATKSSPAFTYSPMTLAGLTANMCTTGERCDIGLFTEWQADYLCFGQNLSTLLAQAEASGTFPWNFRDTRTGAPLNPIANPNQITKVPKNACSINGQVVQIDSGHTPALHYLPFLLTGDPYHLEGLQMAVAAYVPNPPKFTSAGRYLAWPLRDMFAAATVTPATVPSWLLPQSTMQAILSGVRGAVNGYIQAAGSPLIQYFNIYSTGTYPGDNFFAIWQSDMLSLSFGFGVLLGHTDWSSVHQWSLGNLIARTNGTSGWARSNPTSYDGFYSPPQVLAAECKPTDTALSVNPTIQSAVGQAIGSNTDPSSAIFPSQLPFNIVFNDSHESMTVTGFDSTGSQWSVTRTVQQDHPAGHGFAGPPVTTWAALQTLLQTILEVPGSSNNNNALYLPVPGAMDYISYSRAALALGNRLAVPNVAPCFTWLNQQCVSVAAQDPMDRKWMICGS